MANGLTLSPLQTESGLSLQTESGDPLWIDSEIPIVDTPQPRSIVIGYIKAVAWTYKQWR